MSYQSILAKDCNINNSKIRGGFFCCFFKKCNTSGFAPEGSLQYYYDNFNVKQSQLYHREAMSIFAEASLQYT